MKKDNREGFIATRGEHQAYGWYFFGQLFLWTLAGQVTTYLTDIGLAAAVAAAVLLVPKIWDAVNDTLFGYLVDKLDLKGGKFLPWLKIGTYSIGFTTVLMFAIPQSLSTGVKIAWFVAAYLLFDCAYTMLDAPLFALPTVMTSNVQERTSILSTGKFWAMVGTMVSTILLPLIRPKLGWFVTAIIICVIANLTMLPLLHRAKERLTESKHKEPSITFKMMGKYLKSNKYLFVVLLAMLFLGITSVEMVTGLYLARECFGNESLATVMSVIIAVPVMLVAVFVPRLAKKYDKFYILQIGLSISIIASIVLFFTGYGSKAIAFTLMAVKSIGLAMYNIICYMFICDCVEYGTYKSGIRAAGISFSLQTFVSKLKNALVMSIALFALSLFGFVSGEGAVQPAGVADGIWAVYTILPAIGYTIAVLLLAFGYKLRDRDVQVMAQYNIGDITKAQAEEVLLAKFGPAADKIIEGDAVQE